MRWGRTLTTQPPMAILTTTLARLSNPEGILCLATMLWMKLVSWMTRLAFVGLFIILTRKVSLSSSSREDAKIPKNWILNETYFNGLTFSWFAKPLKGGESISFFLYNIWWFALIHQKCKTFDGCCVPPLYLPSYGPLVMCSETLSRWGTRDPPSWHSPPGLARSNTFRIYTEDRIRILPDLSPSKGGESICFFLCHFKCINA